jgi:hypothetical protein
VEGRQASDIVERCSSSPRQVDMGPPEPLPTVVFQIVPTDTLIPAGITDRPAESYGFNSLNASAWDQGRDEEGDGDGRYLRWLRESASYVQGAGGSRGERRRGLLEMRCLEEPGGAAVGVMAGRCIAHVYSVAMSGSHVAVQLLRRDRGRRRSTNLWSRLGRQSTPAPRIDEHALTMTRIQSQWSQNSRDRSNTTWTSKVWTPSTRRQQRPDSCLSPSLDQIWLDAYNQQRKRDGLPQVSYEAFEIVMDKLEKEWFDLVGPCPLLDLCDD